MNRMKTTFSNLGTLAYLSVSAVTIGVLAAFSIANAQTVYVSTTMGPGSSGSQVSALQAFLAADVSVYPEGLVTGFYGSLTTAAVQRYQCNNGIVCQGDVASTGYGRVGPATLSKIQLQQGTNVGGGVNLPPTGFPSSGADVNAPIINRPVVATTSNSATVTWTTNEPSTGRLMYATSWPFLLASASYLASTAGYSQSANATITGLQPNTIYYFVPESVDTSGNLQWSFGNSFRTNP